MLSVTNFYHVRDFTDMRCKYNWVLCIIQDGFTEN